MCCPPFFKDSDYPYGIFKLFLSFCLLSFDRFISVFHQFTALDYPFSIFKLFLSSWKCASYILLSYGTAGSMIPQYLFCLFLLHCSATRRFFYLYIHKHNRHIYRNVWSFCPNVLNFCKYTYFYLFLRNSGHFYFTLIPCFLKCPIIKP